MATSFFIFNIFSIVANHVRFPIVEFTYIKKFNVKRLNSGYATQVVNLLVSLERQLSVVILPFSHLIAYYRFGSIPVVHPQNRRFAVPMSRYSSFPVLQHKLIF